MKNHFKIIVLSGSIFLILGCGSKKLNIPNFQIISKISENHRLHFTKSEIWKFKQTIKLEELEDYKVEIIFKDDSLKKYNFDVQISDWNNRGIKIFNGDTFYYRQPNIKLYTLKDEINKVKYIYSRQIDYKVIDKYKCYLQFYCYSEDSINIDFLNQKFNEIEIVEK